ncbi:MAG: response regulator [Lachnospiraceae bacterium]|nr:response regulator [Lachnospiraceae bacterium]
MNKKRSLSIVFIVASLLLAVNFTDIWILFDQTRSQIKQSGEYQLESVSGKLEATISEAENLTMRMAIKSREYLDDKEALKKFIYDQKREIIRENSGAFNLYIAGEDFCIIPDFVIPKDYEVTERVWYKGAIRNQGRTYVSSPYQDAMTGDICYSVSVMLKNGEAVLGVDYTLENINEYISQMADGAVNAVIVTDEGVIAGAFDEKLIGKKLVDSIPDYAGIYAAAKGQSGVVTGRVKVGFLYENLFATRSGNGWYLIVSIDDLGLYKDSYTQLFIASLLSLALFVLIIILYMSILRSYARTEAVLASREEFLSGITGEFSEPLKRILDRSDKENAKKLEDYEETLAEIHSSGVRLSEMVDQIISYKSIIGVDVKGKEGNKSFSVRGMDKRFRTIILVIMLFVMVVSFYINISSAYQWGNIKMEKEAKAYDYQLSEWISTQKSILDMFTSTISTKPEMLSDYEGTVEYLRRITEQYPEISVTYMTNPALEHTVYMSNGWEPDENWKVEERQWYIETIEAEEGWNISDPYFDDQTGGYCVTISKLVYDAETGEFLGIFGIDFFMDKLVDILGNSYSEEGYAFLVDPDGEIINHPYGAYQMTQNKAVNVQSLPYGETKADGKTTSLFKDYDGIYKILLAERNRESNFAVYVVSDSLKIYGRMLIYGLICILLFFLCIILIYKLLTDLIKWQDKTKQELKEAAQKAISAGKAKSNFLAQMSHEIRTPINAVLGLNEMIIRESRDEEIIDYAENIKSAGKTLLSIINSILDFSKIEDGKMELVPVKYDLSSLINDLVNSISERAKNKGLNFEIKADKNLPATLYGDDVRIKQVIMNLLTNAVKYTEKGEVILTFEGRGIRDDHVTLFVSVKDTGIGIRQEDMGKLFESFERLDKARNRNIEGTGLGMSIVTKLLLMMDSKLEVESLYGEGSVFSFELSQEIIDATPIGDFSAMLKRSIDSTKENRYIFADEARILVVDDNEMNLKVIRSLLKRNGIAPDLATSGFEAIERMTAKKYDIVFLDHMMPQMDGIETLKALKEKKLLKKDTAVIALTANAVSGARDNYINLGFDDYLSKPIDVARLERKLADWLPEDKIVWKELKKGKEDNKKKEKNPQEIVEFQAEEKAFDEIMEFPAEEKEAPDEIMEFPAEEKEDVDGVMEFSPVGKDESDGMMEFEDPGERAEDGEGREKDPLWDELSKAGVDVKAGLTFCAEDEDFYREILMDYVKSYPSEESRLSSLYGSKNWKDFEVVVHALKSTSKTIGAKDISDKAFLLEKAANEKKNDIIEDNYGSFIEAYSELVKAMEKALYH